MKTLKSFYKNKRVLVTGHTGFKGSWLTFWLTEMGAKVCGLSLSPTEEQKLFYDLKLGSKIEHNIANIQEASKVNKIFNDFQPEIVFHLAAQALVQYSFDNPVETFATNVMGSIHVLETVRNLNSIKALIYVTSDKCYKNKNTHYAYKETDEMGGKDPYSASKAAAEILFQSYQDSYFQYLPLLSAVSVRAGNVIGGGDWSLNRIVPDCIESLSKGKEIELRQPQATRPWQHVLEPLGAYLLIGKMSYENPKKFDGSWNFGPEDASCVQVEKLVQKICEEWGGGKYYSSLQDVKRSEAQFLHLSSEKAKSQLGWTPKWNLERTVQEVTTWYKAYHLKQDMELFTRMQIERYLL